MITTKESAIVPLPLPFEPRLRKSPAMQPPAGRPPNKNAHKRHARASPRKGGLAGPDPPAALVVRTLCPGMPLRGTVSQRPLLPPPHDAVGPTEADWIRWTGVFVGMIGTGVVAPDASWLCEGRATCWSEPWTGLPARTSDCHNHLRGVRGDEGTRALFSAYPRDLPGACGTKGRRFLRGSPRRSPLVRSRSAHKEPGPERRR